MFLFKTGLSRDINNFIRACEHLAITPLTGKLVKNPKKSSSFGHMLFEGHRSKFDHFSILLKENNDFKLQLKNQY